LGEQAPKPIMEEDVMTFMPDDQSMRSKKTPASTQQPIQEELKEPEGSSLAVQDRPDAQV